jgi:trehalose utilization protein
MAPELKVTVWNEYRRQKDNPAIAAAYPKSMHTTIAEFLNAAGGIGATCATLDDPECGLSQARLDETDVLIWWGHLAHDQVPDAIVDRVQQRVLAGMGLVVLHSGHFSKIFRRLMGTTCQLKWREAGERHVLWTVSPGHPILAGVKDHFIIEHAEMYSEHFDIPQPDELLLISSFAGGEVFRSACTWRRGAGTVFYFQPGHETYPIYHHPTVQRILVNAVRWLAPAGTMEFGCPNKPMGWFAAEG